MVVTGEMRLSVLNNAATPRPPSLSLCSFPFVIPLILLAIYHPFSNSMPATCSMEYQRAKTGSECLPIMAVVVRSADLHVRAPLIIVPQEVHALPVAIQFANWQQLLAQFQGCGPQGLDTCDANGLNCRWQGSFKLPSSAFNLSTEVSMSWCMSLSC